MKHAALLSLLVGFSLPALAQPVADASLMAKAEAALVLHNAKSKGEAVLKAKAAFIESGKNSRDFKGDVGKDLAALNARLAKEERPILRQAMIVSQLYLCRVAKETPAPELLALTFSEVPAIYHGWDLDPNLLLALEDWAPDLAGAYLAQARADFPDGAIRANLLFEYFTQMIDGAPESLWRLPYTALLKDFPDSPEAAKARERLASERKTAVGELVPPFDVTSLENPAVHYTPETFRGHYVLLDFWATWCPDCAAEMPVLHRAYAKFKDRGLEILSLSFDRKVEHIAPYRLRATTPMPWKHAFLPNGFKNPISEAFGVKSIPKPVLVGPDSRILANGGDLHGVMLERTLEKFLGR